MLALNAKIKIVGTGGARVVDVDNFFQGMFDTAVQAGEILTEIHIAVQGHKMAYVNFPHPASRYTLTGVAVMAGPNWVRAAVTGATSHATRLVKLENALVNKPLTAENIKAACQNLVDPSDLMGDHVASAEYRAHLVNVAAERALLKAAGMGGTNRAMGRAGADDIERIEGIGPKIGQALKAAGIDTYAELAAARQDQLKGILEKAGLPFAPSLETWAEQAGYLARGDEAGFKKLTDELQGGQRK
jgi:predicted flap endonuclease-1-like 5' DNA nuclease